MKGKTSLQLALDCLQVSEAMEICHQVEEYFDILEIGTPLLKSEGVKAVEVIKKAYPAKLVLADTKTMDGGDIEARVVFEVGADIMSVCAAASEETIQSAMEEAKKLERQVLVDLIGVRDKLQRSRELMHIKPHFICIHTGLDQQKKGITPFQYLKEIAENIPLPLALAGGIKPEHLPQIMAFSPSIVIVGGFVTKSSDRKGAAKAMREGLEISQIPNLKNLS